MSRTKMIASFAAWVLTAQPASTRTARVEGWFASTAMCTGVDPPGPFRD